MTCREAQRRILLAQAGELGISGLKRLERHVLSCATCRAYREEADRLTQRAAVALAPPEPGQAALDAIRERIRERADRRPMVRFSRAGWRAAWALAASAILLFGWLAMRNGDTDHSLRRIHAVMALLEDPAEPADNSAQAAPDRQEALRRLGRELLWSQGLWGFEDDVEV